MRAIKNYKKSCRLSVAGYRLYLHTLLTANCQRLTQKIPYKAILYLSVAILLTGPGLVLAELPRTGQRTCFDQEGNMIEHTGTGQDGDYQSGRVWPEPRFNDNGDGTITDLLTGLMWLKNGSCMGWLSWQAAMSAAQELNSMNRGEEHCSKLAVSYDDWYLPTIQELETLLNAEAADPYRFLNFYGFRGIQADSYWSSTAGPNPYSAWLLHFDTSEIMSSGKVETHHVLLVRKEKTEISKVSPAGKVKISKVDPAETDTVGKRNHLLEHLSLLRDKILLFHKERVEMSKAAPAETDMMGTRNHFLEHLSLLREKILLVRKEKIEIVKAAPAEIDTADTVSRFLDNGDGTVTDLETDLMWLKDVNCFTPADWQSGLDIVKAFNRDPLSFNCQDFSVAGYENWTLPNRNELRSLISYSTDLPALATDFPTNNINPYYWTSTTVASYPKTAYDVYMGTGSLNISSKKEKRYIWPVRPVHDRVERQRVPDKTQTMELKAEHYLMRPIGNRIDIAWPAKRFTDHGDGTVIDNLTGFMWLKDSSCLGRLNWKDASDVTQRLNTVPERFFDCVEYNAAYDNWQIPDINNLQNLLEGIQDEPAEWLKRQGAVNVHARDYWSLTENPYNLYHAWAMNMGAGGVRNYPKSFELYVWPFRKQLVVGPVNPRVSIKGSGQQDTLHLSLSQEFILSVAVDYNNGAVLSDFRIWYDAPDGNIWWLTGNGQWHQDERLVFRGNLFHLSDYTVFHAGTSNLAPGDYTFHFSVTPVLQKDQPPVVFSSDLVLTLEEAASTEDVIDEEVTVLLE